FGLTAIGHAIRWEERRTGSRRPQHASTPVSPPEWARQQPVGVWAEIDGRRLLEEAGVPAGPAQLVHSADQAGLAAERFGYPVVRKSGGAGIAHKSDLGGVALNLSSERSVRDAYSRLAQPPNQVLVAPMRTGGHELLAGVTVDPTFGLVVAVGLGGI